MKTKLRMIRVIVILLLSQPMLSQTWMPAKRLTWSTGASRYPAIAMGTGDETQIVYEDRSPGNYEVYFKRSSDGGSTWFTRRLTWSPGNSYNPAIAVDANNHIHIVWQDNASGGNHEIYYKKSTDGGTTWTQKRLTYNAGNSSVSSVAVDTQNHIHVAWGDDTPGNYEIFYKKSTNGGTSWTTKRLTFNPGWSSNPDLAIDSNDYVHMVWLDDSLDSNHEIYYKRSADGGVTWTHKRLTHSPVYSGGPAIALDSSDTIHAVWFDHSSGNHEIYYRKGIQ